MYLLVYYLCVYVFKYFRKYKTLTFDIKSNVCPPNKNDHYRGSVVQFCFAHINTTVRGNHCNEQLLTTEHTLEILSQPVVPDWMEKSNDFSML